MTLPAIRPARAEDAAAIAEIWNHVIRTSVITFTTVEKTDAAIGDLIATAPVLVAEKAGEVQGFATYGPFRSGPGYADAAEHTIYLSQAAQGQGMGHALLAAIEDHAGSNGIRHLVAGMAGSNTRAIAFHGRAGFDQVAHMPGIGQKHGSRHDLVLMMKKLNVPR